MLRLKKRHESVFDSDKIPDAHRHEGGGIDSAGGLLVYLL